MQIEEELLQLTFSLGQDNEHLLYSGQWLLRSPISILVTGCVSISM
uniref:Uncharacterized protein n=1 Tax=Anguilla anguilla TaxID=7936 RepID=A0A0E9T176_ANGAN